MVTGISLVLDSVAGQGGSFSCRRSVFEDPVLSGVGVGRVGIGNNS